MEAPGRIATVAVGYADGWLRVAEQSRLRRSSAGSGFRCVGRVSMDLMTFDVSAVDRRR